MSFEYPKSAHCLQKILQWLQVILPFIAPSLNNCCQKISEFAYSKSCPRKRCRGSARDFPSDHLRVELRTLCDPDPYLSKECLSFWLCNSKSTASQTPQQRPSLAFWSSIHIFLLHTFGLCMDIETLTHIPYHLFVIPPLLLSSHLLSTAISTETQEMLRPFTCSVALTVNSV